MSSLRNTTVYDRLTKPISTRDFLMDVALGRQPGMSVVITTGDMISLDTGDGESTIMDLVGQRMVFSDSLEDIWVSSTNAADTTTSVLVIGMLDDYTEFRLTGTLNGQTPVNFGQLMHVQTVRVLSNSPAGDIYISRANDHSAGVPNNLADAMSYIIQGKNITRNGFFRVPKGKAAITYAIRGNTDSAAKPADINTYIRFPGGLNYQTVSYTVSTAFPQLLFPTPLGSTEFFGENSILLPEGTILEFTAQATSNATKVFFGIDFILADIGLFGGQPIV